MKKRFKIEQLFDFEITLEVDYDLLTEDLAHEINNFWTEADRRLKMNDDDVRLAVIKYAAMTYFGMAMEDPFSTVRSLHEDFDSDRNEGWPPNASKIFKVIDFEIPEPDWENFDVTELEPPHAE